jgi:hypothetical protein
MILFLRSSDQKNVRVSSPTHAISSPVNCLKSDEYEGYPGSIQPFWISREAVAWSWCNLAASQRRLYCSTVNSHYPVGLVSRQWDAVDWACVRVTVAFRMTERADQLHHDNAPAHSTALVQAFFFWQSITSPRSVSSPPAQIWLPATSGFFPKLKSPLKGGDVWIRRSRSTQARSTASHCPLTSPTREWLFKDAQQGLL